MMITFPLRKRERHSKFEILMYYKNNKEKIKIQCLVLQIYRGHILNLVPQLYFTFLSRPIIRKVMYWNIIHKSPNIRVQRNIQN